MPRSIYRNAKGKRLIGVTTPISMFGENGGLLYWANQKGQECAPNCPCGGKHIGISLADARVVADEGTCAHEMCECHLKGEPFDESKWSEEIRDKAENAYLNFLEWKKSVEMDVVALEPTLISEKHQYGGTPDWIAMINGTRCLGDFKTGSVYPSVLMQLAGYKIAWEEMHPDQPLEGYHILQIPRGDQTQAFKHHYWECLPELAEEMFLTLVDLHSKNKRLKRMF